MSEYVVISHDAFARFETVRRKVETSRNCDFCGNKRKNGALFQYGFLEDDSLSGWVNWQSQAFCSISCMRSYNGS
jgi:hypothetical protein